MADNLAQMRAALNDGSSVTVQGAPDIFNNMQPLSASNPRQMSSYTNASYTPTQQSAQQPTQAPSPEKLQASLQAPHPSEISNVPSLDDVSNFLQNLPQQAQRFLTNPQAFTQAVTGKNPLPQETGFAASATSLPEQNPNSLFTPEGMAYSKGYEAGEPIGIAAQFAPFAATAAKPTAKMLAEMAHRQIMETGGIKLPGGFNIPVANYAVKPSGGNWKNSFGGDQMESGNLGRHLQESLRNPHEMWASQLNEADEKAFEEFYSKYHNAENPDPRRSTKSAQDVFTENYNMVTPVDQIKSYSEIAPIVEAYNKWVQGPYKNYITNKMGTGLPNDSVLATIEKENYDPLTRDHSERIARVAQEDREKILKEYQDINKNSPTVKAAFERGSRIFGEPEHANPFTIDLSQPQNQNIGKQTATTEAGKRFEDMVDYHLRTYPKHGDYPLSSEQFPFVKNLPYETPIHDMLSGGSFSRIGLNKLQDYVLKELTSGRLAKEKLPNLSAEAVTQKMIDEAKAEAARTKKSREAYEGWRQQNHDNLPADTSFVDADGKPTGTKMIIFDKTMDPELVKRNLSQETKELNHCSGACGMDNGTYIPMVEPHTGVENKITSTHGPKYLEKIANGDIKVATLRGPKGESKATLELEPTGEKSVQKWFNEFIDNNAFDLVPEQDYANFTKSRYEDGRDFARADLVAKHPELVDKFNEKYPGLKRNEFKVDQIKGHRNGKLTEKDAALVQNWLNYKWKNGDLKANKILDLENLPGVYDLRNGGLQEMLDNHPDINSNHVNNAYEKLVLKKFEQEPLLQEYYERGMIHDTELLQDIMPRFMTKEQILNYLR